MSHQSQIGFNSEFLIPEFFPGHSEMLVGKGNLLPIHQLKALFPQLLFKEVSLLQLSVRPSEQEPPLKTL